MQTLTRILEKKELDGRVLTDRSLAYLFPGEDQRRYNLVNRAIKAGELVRITRGVYLTSTTNRPVHPHPFVIAHTIDPGSYVSAESALSYHSWIPEGVRSTLSVTPNAKSKQIKTDKTTFEFRPVSTRSGSFLELVQRVQLGAQVAFIARPARALIDMAYLKKLEWQGIDWLTESYRIDIGHIRTITGADIRLLKEVYKQKRVNGFLSALSRELSND